MFEKWRWKHGDLATQYKMFADVGKKLRWRSILSTTDFHACLKMTKNAAQNYQWYSSDEIWLGGYSNHIVIVRESIPIGQMEHFVKWMQKVYKSFPSFSFVFFTPQKDPMCGWVSPGIRFYTINPKDYESPYWALQKMIDIESSTKVGGR